MGLPRHLNADQWEEGFRRLWIPSNVAWLRPTATWLAPAGYLTVAGVPTIVGLALGCDPDPGEDEELLVDHQATVAKPLTYTVSRCSR